MKYKKTDLCKQCKERPRKCMELCVICYNVFRRRKVQDQAPKIKCQCKPECKEMIPSITQNGVIMRYKKNHVPVGEKSIRLKYIKEHTDGYLLEYCKGHPQADRAGYVLQHRLVYERYYNVCLLPWTEIHHKDRNKKNNKKISNLIPMFKSLHSSISNLEKRNKDITQLQIIKKCIYVGCKTPNKTRINKKGSKEWFIYKNGYICRNCYYTEYRKNRKLK